MSFDLKKALSNQYQSLQQKPATSKQQPAENDDKHLDHKKNNPSTEILHQWMAPEFEVYEKSARWYLIFAILIVSIIIYALLTNGPIMAITFILIGIVGYVHLQKDPRTIIFSITSKGVIADKELYLYDNIHSFWIFYDLSHTRTISLHTKASMLPFVHIPIQDEDPVALRELLLQNIPEIKQDPSLIDTIERFFHI